MHACMHVCNAQYMYLYVQYVRVHVCVCASVHAAFAAINCLLHFRTPCRDDLHTQLKRVVLIRRTSCSLDSEKLDDFREQNIS